MIDHLVILAFAIVIAAIVYFRSRSVGWAAATLVIGFIILSVGLMMVSGGPLGAIG